MTLTETPSADCLDPSCQTCLDTECWRCTRCASILGEGRIICRSCGHALTDRERDYYIDQCSPCAYRDLRNSPSGDGVER